MNLQETADKVNNLSFEDMNNINKDITVSHIAPVGGVDGPSSGEDLATLAIDINNMSGDDVSDLNDLLNGRAMAKHPC